MLDIKKRIEVIEKLLDTGTTESVTYAALEARLTIEHLFYERLISSQPYYSKSDLTSWTAAQVVRQISREANELIDKEFEIFISKHPNDPENPPTTEKDFESLEWVKLGNQAPLKIRKLGDLHQALSKHALHIDMRRADNVIETYGDITIIRKKAIQALEEFRLLQEGTLLAGSILGEYSFKCDGCGCQIRRKAELLRNDQVISCFNEKCDESYCIHVEDDEITYSRRSLPVPCTKCKTTIDVPTKKIEKLRFGGPYHDIKCTCGAEIAVRLQPIAVQEKYDAPE